MPVSRSLPDIPRMIDPGLYELLQAMRRLTLDNAKRIDDFELQVGSLQAEVAALKAAPPP